MVNKKGLFTLYVLIYTILGIGISLMLFVNFQEHSSTKYLGDSQLNLIELYSEGESDLFYVTQLLSDIEIVSSLFENGGFYNDPNKMNGEYVLWKKNSSDCYPTLNLLDREFSIVFNKKLLNEGYSLDYSTKVINSLSFFEILFNSSKNLDYSIVNKENEEIGIYSLSPNFKILINYDLNNFFSFVEEVKSIVGLCQNDENCWESHATFEWENNGNLFMFESLPQLIQTVNGEKEVKIKAAVDFEEINELVEGEFEC